MFFEASRLLEYVDRRSWTKKNRELSLKWSSPRPCSFRSSNFCCTLQNWYWGWLESVMSRPRCCCLQRLQQGILFKDRRYLIPLHSVVSTIIKLQWFRAPIKKCVLFWMLWCCLESRVWTISVPLSIFSTKKFLEMKTLYSNIQKDRKV